MTDLATLRVEIRGLLGVDETDLPNDTVVTSGSEKVGLDLLLNQAYWEVLDKNHFREKEVTATFPTVAGTRFYKVPSSFEALQQLSIEDLDSGLHSPLERATEYEYESIFQNTTDSQGKPSKYLREGNGIRLWLTPDNAYTVTIKYWKELTDLSSTNLNPEIPRTWHEIIKYGAAWRGAAQLGDYAKVQMFMAIHGGLMKSAVTVEAKEEGDTHTGGVEVLGYDPSANL